MVTADRADEYARLRGSITDWAQKQSDVVGVAIVGSWARDEPRMDSDLDLVILTEQKELYVANDDWIASALGEDANVVRTQEWGPLTERRIALASGFEVEFGFVAPAWAETNPLDSGTARIVRDGCEPLLDAHALFARLNEAAAG